MNPTRQKYRTTFYLILLLLAGATSHVPAQTTIEESLLEEAEDAHDLLEQLEQWKQRPLDLNHASLRDFLGFPMMSSVMARNILQERRRNGPFHSVADAAKRLGWDAHTRDVLSPYITVSPRRETGRLFHFRERISTRLPQAAGYNDGSYEGNPCKYYHRLTIQESDRLEGGLLIEKDAGELTWNDHWVGYIDAYFPAIGLHTVLGHYRLEYGQGLVFWGPYGLGKGADPIAPVRKRSKLARGYASSDENRFFTGLTLDWRRNDILVSISASRTPLDATLQSDGTVKTLTHSGLHRNSLEQSKKDQTAETLLGGRIEASGSWGRIGITGFVSRYARQVSRRDPERYVFAFDGTHNHVIGLDAECLIGSAGFSGEIAVSRSGGWAALFNAIIEIQNTNADVALLVRRFTPDFHNPHSRGFGFEQAENERGIYLGFRGRITKSTRLSFYYDVSRKPWRTYTLPVPTNRTDLFVQLEQRFSSTQWTIRLRTRQKENMQPTAGPWRPTEMLSIQNHVQFRCECRLRPIRGVEMRTRFETVRVSQPRIVGDIATSSIRENGILLYQDMRYKTKQGLAFVARWISFDTPSYESRIYEYESDLPGVLSARPLYEKGFRWYVLIGWKKNYTRLYLKLGVTHHEGVDSWGTGPDEIPHHTVT